jgi:FtsP/CotA-like multicopper oxidase with cupredoxin domain
MKTRHSLTRISGALSLAALVLAASAGTASAASYTIRAGASTVVMPPDNTVIPVWGFAPVAGFDNNSNVVSVPGPVMRVPTDEDLIVTVQNGLPAPNGMSLMIPGLGMPVNAGGVPLPPVFFTDPQGRRRVKSFTAETAPGGSVTYTFTNLRPGTFLYESGTDPSVHVPMGLYGAVVVRPAGTDVGPPGQAYAPASTAYANELILFFSELDPVLNQAVFDNTYGGVLYPSSLDYEPKYFLINGAPYPTRKDPYPVGAAGTTTLLRFLNVSNQIHVPVVHGAPLSVLAEDGGLYPFPEPLYSLVLSPGKTMDALLNPQQNVTIPLFDRRGYLSNRGTSPGGMIAFLRPAGSDVAPPSLAGIQVVPTPTNRVSPVLLTASATDAQTGPNSYVVYAEWTTDPATPNGKGTPMTGAFGTGAVALSAAIDVSGFAPGPYTLFVRAQDASGNWGGAVTDNVTLNVTSTGAAAALTVTRTAWEAGQTVTVEAVTSAAPGSVTLLATSPDGTVTYGPLVYIAGSNSYLGEFRPFPEPASVRVVLLQGASVLTTVTVPVPFP